MVDIVVAVIEAVYSFLWDDLITVPLPGGGTIGFSCLLYTSKLRMAGRI